MWRAAVAVALAFHIANAAFYDSYSGKQISPAKYEQYRLQRLIPYCAVEVKECDPKEWRRLDCTCNNLHYPQRGATLTPYRRMLPPVFGRNFEHRYSSSGAPLPNARKVRTSINSDGRVASKEYTQLVTNGVVAITGDITSVHDTLNYVLVTTNCCQPGGEQDPRCMPVRVPNDDIHLRRSNVRCLNLTRAITYQSLGCVPETLPPERINTSPPMLELSIIYGNDEPTAMRARERKGGRLTAEYLNGKEWPPTGSVYCIQNQMPRETRCHNTPVPATNILIGANIMSLWFFRSHNNLARKLEALNPCWDDDRIFYEAREINIAYVNQMWYYEMMPSLMGYKFLVKNKVIYETMGHINDYDYTLEPQVSIEYVVTTRWFHTMQDGRIKMYDKKGKMLDELQAVELTLRTGILPLNGTIEGMTQGSFRQPSAAADHFIDPDMGERVLGGLQFASDVMTSDIMKNRDAGLPPYTEYRKVCGLPVPKDFDDLLKWMPEELVDSLRFRYEKVEDMDLMAGILSEKAMPGGAFGPTLACIMVDQLRHWRRADRFWYENKEHPGAFNKEQLYQIRQMTMARFICDHGDDVDSVQPYAFLVPGRGNEITDCKKIRKSELEPWRDETCYKDKKYNDKDTKYYGGDSKNYGGDNKNYGGDSKNYGGDSKNYGGDSKNYGGDSKHYGGNSKQYEGDANYYDRNIKQSTGGNEYYDGDGKYYGGDSTNYGGDNKNYGGDNKNYGGDNRNYGGDTKYYDREFESSLGDNTYYGGDANYYDGNIKYNVGDKKYNVGNDKYNDKNNKNNGGDNKYNRGDNKYNAGENKNNARDNKYNTGENKNNARDSKYNDKNNKHNDGDTKYKVLDIKYDDDKDTKYDNKDTSYYGIPKLNYFNDFLKTLGINYWY